MDFIAVCAPSCCGKTELTLQILLKNSFYPNLRSIYYIYQHEKLKFSSIESNLKIFSHNFFLLNRGISKKGEETIFKYQHKKILNNFFYSEEFFHVVAEKNSHKSKNHSWCVCH